MPLEKENPFLEVAFFRDETGRPKEREFSRTFKGRIFFFFFFVTAQSGGLSNQFRLEPFFPPDGKSASFSANADQRWKRASLSFFLSIIHLSTIELATTSRMALVIDPVPCPSSPIFTEEAL